MSSPDPYYLRPIEADRHLTHDVLYHILLAQRLTAKNGDES